MAPIYLVAKVWDFDPNLGFHLIFGILTQFWGFAPILGILTLFLGLQGFVNLFPIAGFFVETMAH